MGPLELVVLVVFAAISVWGCRFLLADRTARANLAVALAPIIRASHHFGCGAVYQLQPRTHTSDRPDTRRAQTIAGAEPPGIGRHRRCHCSRGEAACAAGACSR